MLQDDVALTWTHANKSNTPQTDPQNSVKCGLLDINGSIELFTIIHLRVCGSREGKYMPRQTQIHT